MTLTLFLVLIPFVLGLIVGCISIYEAHHENERLRKVLISLLILSLISIVIALVRLVLAN